MRQRSSFGPPTADSPRSPMHRREWFKIGALAGAATGISWLSTAPLAEDERKTPHTRDSAPNAAAAPRTDAAKLKITDVRTILTAPAGIRLVVVKVLTNEPGLYGLGCATFTQRARVVETAV